MKIYNTTIYLLSFLLAICSCTPDYDKLSSAYFTQVALDHPDYNIVFENNVRDTNPKYRLICQVRASPDDQTIIASIMLINLSDSPVTLDYNNFTLETPDGNYSQPTNLTSSVVIPNGDLLRQNLIFKPINNRRLFMKTGERGDLNRSYILRIEGETVKLSSSFELSPPKWENYLINYSKEKEISIFNAEIDKDKQQIYQVEFGKSDFVHADENEISVAGTNLQFNAFQIKDTFNLHIKIINHGNDILDVTPNYLSDILGNESLLISGDLETQKVEKSKRFIQKYTFYCPKPIKSFVIPRGFLILPADSKSTPLLMEDIVFKKRDLE